jgi:hypothetical protein
MPALQKAFNGKNKYFTVGGIVGVITLALIVCVATIPGKSELG